MRTLKFTLSFLIILFTAIACRESNKIIVSAYDEVLTIDDLQDMLPAYNDKDSAEITQLIIEKWIEQQALYHEAQKALSLKDKKFEKEINAYKQALIIHRFENKYIEQHINKDMISQEEINNYYQQHQEQFQLKQNVIKVNYIKLPLKCNEIETSKKLLFKTRTENENIKLDKICGQYAINSYLQDNWLLFDDILKEIPIKNYTLSQFNSQDRQLEIKDSLYVYLINVMDFRISEGISPLSIVQDKIINSLVQQKQKEALQHLREQAVEKAKNNGEILYNN